MQILVVDDSASMRKVLRAELESSGYEVIETARGEEALDYLMVARPDLVTLDVNMEGWDGFETCRHLRETPEGADIPVIFVTANDTLTDRERGFEVGATDFISKNAARGELSRVVNRLLMQDRHLEGLTALVVEDSGVARRIVVSCLQEEGVEVLEAEDGPSGVEIAKEKGDDLDLVILDYLMPGMNGDEVCREMRRRLGLTHVPIVFLSAIGEKASILDMFRAGGTDYLVKPFVKEELLARINVHLDVRRLNSALRDHVEELTELNRMKDEFVAVASHDLKSPLNGIMGFAELSLMEDGLPAEVRSHLDQIERSAEFLLDMVQDILDLSRFESREEDLDNSRIDTAEIARSSITTVQHMANPKNIALELEENIMVDPVIMGDGSAFLRVMNNLLSNAVKFTPDGGTVTVLIESDGPKALAVSVMDTGIGIPESELPGLFDKFTRASQSGTAGEPGTGLGLAITKEIVEKHGGTVEVASEVDHGTTFMMRFPLAPEEEE